MELMNPSGLVYFNIVFDTYQSLLSTRMHSMLITKVAPKKDQIEHQMIENTCNTHYLTIFLINHASPETMDSFVTL